MEKKIECQNISKKFIWYERKNSLKHKLTSSYKTADEVYEWSVLKNLSFEIQKGERVAVIGKNGCGKTTLLKMITGIYRPSSGRIRVYSERTLGLIELGVGFYDDLTGSENIKLNWVFNGLPKKELASHYDEIVRFSELQDFLSTPVKYYSSGMMARLGFSIAIHARPDLLIVDEILAVGDAEFQQRCYKKIDEYCKNGLTLILVSHNLDDVRRTCTRAIWLDHGEIRMDGSVEEVLPVYESEFQEEEEEKEVQ